MCWLLAGHYLILAYRCQGMPSHLGSRKLSRDNARITSYPMFISTFTAVLVHHSAAPASRGPLHVATLQLFLTMLLYLLCCVSIPSNEERCKCQMRMAHSFTPATAGAKICLQSSRLQTSSPLLRALVRVVLTFHLLAGCRPSLFPGERPGSLSKALLLGLRNRRRRRKQRNVYQALDTARWQDDVRRAPRANGCRVRRPSEDRGPQTKPGATSLSVLGLLK